MENNDTGVMENVADSQDQHASTEYPTQDKNWEAVRETLAQQKQETNAVKQQLAEARNFIANMQKEKEVQELGDPTDYTTKGEMQQRFDKEKAALEQRLQYLEAKMTNSDYDEVINNEFAKLANENPRLYESVLQAPNASLLAYELGKARKTSNSKVRKDVDRIIENASKPASINSAVGGGTSAISHADKIKSMSRQEFNDYVEKVKRGMNR